MKIENFKCFYGLYSEQRYYESIFEVHETNVYQKNKKNQRLKNI
jgi:hypothetical protein